MTGSAEAHGAPNRYGRTSRLELEAALGAGGRTVLARAYATQPFRVMKPFEDPRSPTFAQVIAMSSSAGLMEGDAQRLGVAVGAGAALSVRAQAFEKVHRMDGAGWAARATELAVAPGGRLRFLQQPVIPYAGSRFTGDTVVELADATAGVAYGEVIACGRAAAGERFAFSSFANRVLVTVAGEPAFADNLVLDPGAGDVAGLGMFEGFAHMGSLVVLAPDLSAERFEAARSALRALTDPDEGAVAWDDAPAGFFGARDLAARDLDARGLSAQGELAASFVPGGALIGGITHLGEVAGATGWAVRLLGDRAQDLQRALDLVAHLAGF